MTACLDLLLEWGRPSVRLIGLLARFAALLLKIHDSPRRMGRDRARGEFRSAIARAATR